MSNEDLDASSANIEAAPTKSETKPHPAPSMVWMLIPVALLGLLAFLSR